MDVLTLQLGWWGGGPYTDSEISPHGTDPGQVRLEVLRFGYVSLQVSPVDQLALSFSRAGQVLVEVGA